MNPFTQEQIDAQRVTLEQLVDDEKRLAVYYVSLLDEARSINSQREKTRVALINARAKLNLMMAASDSPTAGQWWIARCLDCKWGHRKNAAHFHNKDEARVHALKHLTPEKIHHVKLVSVIRWN